MQVAGSPTRRRPRANQNRLSAERSERAPPCVKETGMRFQAVAAAVVAGWTYWEAKKDAEWNADEQKEWNRAAILKKKEDSAQR